MQLIHQALLCMAAVLGASGMATAQSYPNKPIRIIVPYGAGGQTDIVARVLGDKLSKRLGQPVIVENRSGGGGNPGTDYVAKSTPDGYTLVTAAISNFGANPALYGKVPFDPVKDFAPVVHAISTTNVLVVNPGLPAQNLQDIIKMVKAKPGQMNYASAGAGTSIHLFMEVLRQKAGMEIVHVPYRGSAPALVDVLGGQVPMIFDSMPSVIPFIKSGRLRPIAVSSGVRSAALPDVPTVAESGIPGFDLVSWIGLAAPAGTPVDIIQKLNPELNGKGTANTR